MFFAALMLGADWGFKIVDVAYATIGYGDGGGGADYVMAENGRRLKDMPGIPKVEMATVSRFFERATEKLGAVTPRRDDFELALAQYVLSRTNKPVLGICRGIQVLNVAMGGTLHIDLPADGKLCHSLTMYPRNVRTHEITILDGTRLEQVMGLKGRVNSFHHQAIKDIAEGLIVTAVSEPDQVIEAVEATQSLSVQSLDVQAGEDEDTPLWSLIGQEDSEIDNVELKDLLARVIETLSEAEKKVLQMRYFEERTQRDIANEMGVSQMFVSRVERKMLARFREALVGA